MSAFKTKSLAPLLPALLAIVLVLPGCPGAEKTGDGVEQDTATDYQVTAKGCSETCVGPLCVERVTGRLLKEDGSPVANQTLVKFCIPNCNYLQTDAAGNFEFEFFGGCGDYDFSVDAIWDLEVLYEPGEASSHYVVALEPTQEQISDDGTGDYLWDLGDFFIFDLPETSFAYEPSMGVDVEHQGLSFEVLPFDLGSKAQDVNVFKAPLDTWDPPFVNNPYYPVAVNSVDALYYITPYWTPVGGPSGEGLEYRFDPPAGWSESEPGSAFVLGDWYNYYLEHPENGEIAQGAFEQWGAITWDNGQIVTPPIPLFGWIGIAKD